MQVMVPQSPTGDHPTTTEVGKVLGGRELLVCML